MLAKCTEANCEIYLEQKILLRRKQLQNELFQGTVSRDWIGPCIVLIDGQALASIYCMRRFSDFLWFLILNSSKCSCSVLIKKWRLCTALAASGMQKQHATGGQSHTNCNQVAASHMQHEKVYRNLPASGSGGCQTHIPSGNQSHANKISKKIKYFFPCDLYICVIPQFFLCFIPLLRP